MGILNRLFGNIESLEKEVMIDEESIKAKWDSYFSRLPEKQEIIAKLVDDPASIQKIKLKDIIHEELLDVTEMKTVGHEQIYDIIALEHKKDLSRLERLEQCLAYEESKRKYLESLLWSLFRSLQRQLNLIKYPDASIIMHLQQELKLEKKIAYLIDNMKDKTELFAELFKRQSLIKNLYIRRNSLLFDMRNEMYKSFRNWQKKGMLEDWTYSIYLSIIDDLKQGDMPFEKEKALEYMNSVNFKDKVSSKLRELQQEGFTDDMVEEFIRLFSEWYTDNADHCTQ